MPLSKLCQSFAHCFVLFCFEEVISPLSQRLLERCVFKQQNCSSAFVQITRHFILGLLENHSASLPTFQPHRHFSSFPDFEGRMLCWLCNLLPLTRPKKCCWKEPHQMEMCSVRIRGGGVILQCCPTHRFSRAGRNRGVRGDSLPALQVARLKDYRFLFSCSSRPPVLRQWLPQLVEDKNILKWTCGLRRIVPGYTKRSGLVIIFLWLGFLTSVCSNLSGNAFCGTEIKQ